MLSATAPSTLTAGRQSIDRQNSVRHYAGSLLSATLLRQWDQRARDLGRLSGSQVAIVTGDTAMRLRAEAEGIATFAMPASAD